MKKDINIIRDLAKKYLELANDPVQEERRRLWARHFSLKPTPKPLVLVTYGMWNVWCKEVFGDDKMECEDPFFIGIERKFKMDIFHASIGDDYIIEPFISIPAAKKGDYSKPWGVEMGIHSLGVDGSAYQIDPPLKNWEDISKIKCIPHIIDEEETERKLAKIKEAIDGILEVDVLRGAYYSGFAGDISTFLARLRGLEQIMIDMYESPQELHYLLALMRDGILANNQEVEDKGGYTLTCHANQAMPYSEELEWPRPNSGPRKRKDLWGFCAAQEYTLISPEFHEEFLFNYQLPIMEHFGLVHYGCCEDLTNKIDMLKKLKNLRSIAVTPRADIKKCAERIGKDYVASWRPSPADMVCCGWSEERIRSIISEGAKVFKGCYMHIHLKDIETLEGDTSRLARWVKIVREELDKVYGN